MRVISLPFSVFAFIFDEDKKGGSSISSPLCLHSGMRRYNDVFCAVPVKEQDPSMTVREQELYALSAAQYVHERRTGRVSCVEYASALVKRAKYYRYLNQWTYRSYDLFHQALETAKALDMKV